MARLRRFSWLGLLLILAGCRQDMHDQPRFKPLAMNDFYPDLRSARPPVDGTVARGQLNADTYFYTGKIGANPGDYMPFPVTEDVLSRGRERFNIYCAPCHSRALAYCGLHSRLAVEPERDPGRCCRTASAIGCAKV